MGRIKIALTMFITVALQVLDLVSTKLALADPGMIELNPFGRYFIANGFWWEFLFIKLGILFIAFVSLLFTLGKDSVIRVAWIVNVVMAIVVMNNFYWNVF